MDIGGSPQFEDLGSDHRTAVRERGRSLIEHGRQERRRAERGRQMAQEQIRRAERGRRISAETVETSMRLVWQARKLVYDRYGPAMAMWSGDVREDLKPDSQFGDVPAVDAPEAAPIDIMDLAELVNRLFGISLVVSALERVVGEARTERVRAALDLLDGLIHDVRDVVFSEPCQAVLDLRGAAQTAQGPDAPPPSTPAQPTVLGPASPPSRASRNHAVLLMLLRESSLTLDGLLHSVLAASGPVAADLSEASRAAHRALARLTPEPAAEYESTGAGSKGGVSSEGRPGRPFHVEVEHEPGVQVVRLIGDSEGADLQALTALLASFGETAVCLDLSGLTFMDRTVLQAVVDAKRERQSRGLDLAVVGITGVVRRLLEALGMTDLV